MKDGPGRDPSVVGCERSNASPSRLRCSPMHIGERGRTYSRILSSDAAGFSGERDEAGRDEVGAGLAIGEAMEVGALVGADGRRATGTSESVTAWCSSSPIVMACSVDAKPGASARI